MKTRLFALLCLLCLFPTLLSGCWQEELPDADDGLLAPLDTEEPEAEAAVLPKQFSLPYMPRQTLDPITCPSGMQQVVGSLLYEGLFQLDEHLDPQPALCSSYSYDSAAFVYTFSIRPGVTFSDGTPLTAAHAAAALERARTSERYRARLAQVRAISAGDGVLTISLTGPNTGFPALLDIPISKPSDSTLLVPLGTGPYFYSTEGGTHLSANPGWWQGSGQPVARIGLSAAGDRETMLYQFTSHDVQLITADMTGTEPVSVTGSFSYQDADTTILQYVGINTTRPPLDNAALRSALSKGINRASMISAFLSGHGRPAQAPVSPASSLYPAGLDETYSYDAFAAAMEAAGYGTGRPGRTVTLLVNQENSFKLSAASYIAQALSAFALQVEVRALPWAEFTAALAEGKFDLYYGEVMLTADWDLTALVGTGGSLNYGGWTDHQTDQLLAACAASGDRTAALRALCAHLRTQAPLLPICFKSTSVVYQTDVIQGLCPTMGAPFHRLSNCSIHLKES